VINTIRPGISEGNIPAPAILQTLIIATCRRHGVIEKDVFSAQQISEELIKEVMNSSFLSSSAKEEYCTKLLTMHELQSMNEEKINVKKNEVLEAEIRRRIINNFVFIIGIMVGVIAFFIIIVDKILRSYDSFNFLKVPISIGIVLCAVTVAMVLVQVVSGLKREIKRPAKNPEPTEPAKADVDRNDD
jgi:hypothetical protein